MKELFIDVIEITSRYVREIVNRRINSDEIIRLDGFVFKMIYCDEKFFQARIHAYNTYTTQLLFPINEDYGRRVGSQYDKPLMLETDGGFAGVLCTYILIISQSKIESESVLYSISGKKSWVFSVEEYRALKDKCAHSERISCFSEMMNYIQRDTEYRKAASTMISQTKVYGESFFSSRNPDRKTTVSYQENLTLLAAKECVANGKHTAVLNFANPIVPGGGVLNGAKAQEENICRSSNLYKSLTSAAADEYYRSNKEILSMNQFNSMFLGSDRVIYSPDVLVLKENTDYRTGRRFLENEQYSENPFRVDVISCGAPFFSGSGYILPNGDLKHVFTRRIRNILEAAIDNEVEALILGAFGCGAFHNPANIVADAFREVLLETRYRTAFDLIIFAVKRTDIICPNIEAFERNFTLFPQINYQGKEKLMRDQFKWECSCGMQNSWDDIYCIKCHTHRSKWKGVNCFYL